MRGKIFLLFLLLPIFTFSSWLFLTYDGSIIKGDIKGIEEDVWILQSGDEEVNINFDDVIFIINEEETDILNNFFWFTDKNGNFPTFMLKNGDMLIFELALFELNDASLKNKIWENYPSIFENLNNVFLETDPKEINNDFLIEKLQESFNSIFNTSIVNNIWIKYHIQK